MKIKYVVSWAFYLLWIPSLFTQELQVLQRFTSELKGNLDVVQEELILTSSSLEKGLITTPTIELKESELIITYSLEPLKEGQYYHISLDIQLNTQKIFPNAAYLKGSIGKMTEIHKIEKIIWKDLLEQFINLEGEFQLRLSAELWGKPTLPFNIDCANPPSFSLKQKWPHFAAGALGLGVISAGLWMNNEATRIYEEDYLPAIIEANAEPFYQDATQKRENALILLLSGAGVVVIDAVWYTIRQVNYKKRKKAFDTYCKQNQLSIVPTYLFPIDRSMSGQMGVKLTYTFGAR